MVGVSRPGNRDGAYVAVNGVEARCGYEDVEVMEGGFGEDA